jgi:hypothetical protein
MEIFDVQLLQEMKSFRRLESRHLDVYCNTFCDDLVPDCRVIFDVENGRHEG